ncbi:MAG: NAD(P)/FAD-dependent oxidoreductase [Ardenticatenia bacterium]|nr:NAD(P)/FAD-dependent oxidoreductase [Ardenticatenia bacterium]
MTPHVLVLGGGPAAWEAARAASVLGAQVTVVTEGPLGGRAGWHSLLPSKVWLHLAEMRLAQAEAHHVGLDGGPGAPAAPRVVARIRDVARAWNSARADALRTQGVRVIEGVGTFLSPSEVAVRRADGTEVGRLTADAFVVATGSVPIFPPQMRPDGRRVIAPRFASHLEELPRSVVVVGGGATGSEFTFLFNALGLDVTWVVDEQGVLPMFHSRAGRMLAEAMSARGVRLLAGTRATSIEPAADGITVSLADGRQVGAELAFIAVGRRPDTDRLALEVAGVAVREDGAVAVDAWGRTTVPHIFAAGDVTGKPMIANRAMAQGYVAGTVAAGGTTPPVREETVVFAIYTEPQVAQVGTLQGEQVRTVTVPFTESLKGLVVPGGNAGVLELAYRADDGHVVGGVAVGPHAADVLTPVAQAIAANMTVRHLAALFPAHPTLSEVAFVAARRALWP